MEFQKQRLNFLAFLSLIIFTVMGWMIHWYFLPYNLLTSLIQGSNYLLQAITGIAFGLLASFFSWQLIQSSVLKETRRFFFKLLKPFEFKISDIIIISVSAGIGEEILFRGSIQPFLGIWVTALIFVMLHGYISYRNLQLTIYGIYMVFVAAGLGYLSKHIGLISAITAHCVIDIALLMAIANDPDSYDGEEIEASNNLTELTKEESP